MTFCNLSSAGKEEPRKAGTFGSPGLSKTNGYYGSVAGEEKDLMPSAAKAKCPGRVRAWPKVMTMGRQPRLDHDHQDC